ncbi:MAG: hypothetical protein EAZ77_14185 [Nostocales cyanobacterium]|nr:MAG: hypothetical protein EAZ77_14185 [Nostocales cyanobacterium]
MEVLRKQNNNMLRNEDLKHEKRIVWVDDPNNYPWVREQDIEVEYSRPKIDKLKLYAAMGISEFWRYNGTKLRIYILTNGQYSETQISPTFAPIQITAIPRFIQESKKIGQMSATRAFRNWVKLAIND